MAASAALASHLTESSGALLDVRTAGLSLPRRASGVSRCQGGRGKQDDESRDGEAPALGFRAAHPAPTPSRQAQNLPKALRRPAAAGPIPPGLHVSDRPGIESGTGGQLLLGEPQPEPGCPDPARQTVPFRDETRSEDRLDSWPPPGQRLALVPLPRRDRLRAAAHPVGKGLFRQP